MAMSKPMSPPYKPIAVSDAQVAFPASVRHMMPAEKAIPEEFWSRNDWTRIVDSWFASGLPADVEFHMAEGIDGEKMFRHMRCVLGSYEQKHEYKVAAAAYLLSLWCTSVEGWQHA